jgi:hypothetical protein
LRRWTSSWAWRTRKPKPLANRRLGYVYAVSRPVAHTSLSTERTVASPGLPVHPHLFRVCGSGH